jgi:hypothetical protein
MTGKECAEALSLMINCNDKVNLNQFIETLRRDHKLLQDGEIKLLCKTLKMFSEVRTDARNENAVTVAQKIVDTAEEYFGPIKPNY